MLSKLMLVNIPKLKKASKAMLRVETPMPVMTIVIWDYIKIIKHKTKQPRKVRKTSKEVIMKTSLRKTFGQWRQKITITS
jgi:hypothetical protein